MDRQQRREAVVRATLGVFGSVLLVVAAAVHDEVWYWIIALAAISSTVLVARSAVQLLRESRRR